MKKFKIFGTSLTLKMYYKWKCYCYSKVSIQRSIFGQFFFFFKNLPYGQFLRQLKAGEFYDCCGLDPECPTKDPSAGVTLWGGTGGLV